MARASICLGVLCALAASSFVTAAPCASAPATPTACRNADSCVAASDVCNQCAGNFWLSDAATGACVACRDEATAANAHLSGATTCAQANATFAACVPWGATVDARCINCDKACSSCTGTGNVKSYGCTACATGYFDSNGGEQGGTCELIKSETVGSILGLAEQFAVLAASTVTNTGATKLTGDIGVSPGTAITGFPPGIVVGVVHATDPTASTAEADAGVAHRALAGKASDATMSGTDLGGLTLAPGVYKFGAAAALTGALTLDAKGDKNALFVFQIGTALTVNVGSNIVLSGSAVACNVYWQVGSGATIGSGVAMVGNIISSATTVLQTGASLNGRAISLVAAVTLDSNAVTALPCGITECNGPNFLVPKAGQTAEYCAACDAACSNCTAVTNNQTAGCTACAYGYYIASDDTCLACRSHQAAAQARVAGSLTCNANGAAFYFKDCQKGVATAATDAVCAPVATEAQLAAAITAGSTTCGGSGAYFFAPATASSNAECTPCDPACSQCTGPGNDKRVGCTTCASGYKDSTEGMAGGTCDKIVDTSPGQSPTPQVSGGSATRSIDIAFMALAVLGSIAATV